jgi:hypothetical protein
MKAVAPVPCPSCYDAKRQRITGTTAETSPVIHDRGGKWVTVKRGSGCPVCLGLGVLKASFATQRA